MSRDESIDCKYLSSIVLIKSLKYCINENIKFNKLITKVYYIN